MKQKLKAQIKEQVASIAYDKGFPSPFLFKDLKKGALKIIEAIKTHTEILVVGDYDADGIISSTIMAKFFASLGYGHVRFAIPNRFIDGYGISKKFLEKHHAPLIITVDNGISAFEAADFCKEKNYTLIITDHHCLHNNEVPNAYAVINPQQPDCAFVQKEVCGALVAFYLCYGIHKLLEKEKSHSSELLCLAGVATIADMMPLTFFNRFLVSKALYFLQKESLGAMGFLRQKEVFRKRSLKASDISFNIAPLINSAGRMQDPKLALDFLNTNNMQDCYSLYERLKTCNLERKIIQQQVFEEAYERAMIGKKIVVAFKDNWHEGVLGIVASKLVEATQKPSLVLTFKDGVYKGSGRSSQNIDLIDALCGVSSLLLGYGGHRQACGLSIEKENLVLLFETLESFDFKVLPTHEKETPLKLRLKDIDKELLEIIELGEPYGQENPEPLFKAQNLEVIEEKIVKESHQILRFRDNECVKDAIYFCAERFLKVGEKVSVLFSVELDEYSNEPKMFVKSLL
ncbi:single-stranded-DNA-specific exonuclease RecJ [Helicobacter cetorum]|uniref:Single-stranded-DNA-specific exonuclease RecJ n=1 Tax=Helicobacter cetorum (strain ATCC BAA-540 / CCUG 52418 / MIT 99-5656) TaxID=1163745 RepID=I0ER74_HELCM|nr:single-stranded-DNA-specific exonuclease RecJ [Helicobacter cetorum]AFI05443.1 single-stranded-DNA-specific exonuclease [Helicobacter cetorum MIT 99-5656]